MTSFYHTILENANVFHKYFDLKAKILGQKNLAIYDLRAGTMQNEKEYSFDEAYDIVLNATSVLGEDYTQILKQAKSEALGKYIWKCGVGPQMG